MLHMMVMIFSKGTILFGFLIISSTYEPRLDINKYGNQIEDLSNRC